MADYLIWDEEAVGSSPAFPTLPYRIKVITSGFELDYFCSIQNTAANGVCSLEVKRVTVNHDMTGQYRPYTRTGRVVQRIRHFATNEEMRIRFLPCPL